MGNRVVGNEFDNSYRKNPHSFFFKLLFLPFFVNLGSTFHAFCARQREPVLRCLRKLCNIPNPCIVPGFPVVSSSIKRHLFPGNTARQGDFGERNY